MTYLGTAEVYGINKALFKGKTKINRKHYGLTWNDGETKSTNFAGKIAESTGAVGDEVEITLNIQAKLETPTKKKK